MRPTSDFLNLAEKRIRLALQELRPELLELHGAIEHELKDDATVVTKADVMVENRLKRVLAEIDPSIGFGGEETGVDYDQETFWLVDPIDGTEWFVRGLPFSTNMITLIDSGQPVMGIIYNYFLDEYYLAIKDKGATRNGHAIHVSNRTLDRSYVMMGGRVGKDYYGVNDRLRDLVRGMPKFHASGFDYSSIARGAVDGAVVWFSNGHVWDFAPGTLLVQEAGGRVENLEGGSYDYRNTKFIAANPIIFDQLKDFVTQEKRLAGQGD
jgi:myo-inositol-1(or 4)-monophosphatase